MTATLTRTGGTMNPQKIQQDPTGVVTTGGRVALSPADLTPFTRVRGDF